MSAKESGYKWSKFVWDDWGNDAALQSCNVAAQGLWINLLRVMFNNERQGYLQINNKPMTPTQIAKITGIDSRTITNQLKVLIKNNVCSVDENGIVFSRRMVRESKAKSDKVAANTHRVSNDHAATMQRVCNEDVTCTQKEIAENSQKQDPLNKNRIDKNRIDKKKEKSNKKESENLVGDQGDVSPNGSTKKGSRLPDDWMPTENDIAYAQNLNLDPEKIAEDFCDWWHAKAGAGARKTDWSLTWKTWCRRENEKNQEKQQRFNAYNQPRKSNLERIGEKIDRAAEHYGVDDWFENGVPQDLSTKPKLQLVGGSKW